MENSAQVCNKMFGVGFKPTISRSLDQGEGGIGDSYTITSSDPNPNDRICYRVDELGVSHGLTESLCDGTTGQCNQGANAIEFLPGVTEDISLFKSSTIRAIVYVPDHALVKYLSML